MRRKVVKLRQFNLGGAKVNSTCIGTLRQSFFAIGDSQNNIRLYTFENEQQVEVYANHNNNTVQTEITAVALSATQKELISGTNRGIINIWDMETAKTINLLKGHTTSVNCFGIFPEEPTTLASGSYDTTIKLWDIRKKENTSTLKGHTKQINSIAISPDSIMLLSGSQDNSARLWDLRYPDKAIYIAGQHNGPILKAKFNPEDCMFATCSMDKTAKYFKCQQKNFAFASSTDMIATPITAIGFNQDGRVLYTAANDVLKSWNMYKGGVLLQNFETGWRGIQEIAMIKGALMGVAFYQNNLSLWVCDVNRKIKNSSSVYNQSSSSFVLPPINNKLNNKSQSENNNNKMMQINQIQNIVGMAVNKVNKIQEKPTKDYMNQKKNEQLQRKKMEMQKKKVEEERRRKQAQMQRQRVRFQREEKERKEREKRQFQRLKKQEQERVFQEKLYQQRLIRQKQMQTQVQKTLQQLVPQNEMEKSLYPDMLQNSQMKMSTYIQDADQKDKMQQIELIGEILQNKKLQIILKQRTKQLLPILNYWKKGEIIHSLQVARRNKNANILIDFTNAILNNNHFKSGVNTEAAIHLSSILCSVMSQNAHGTYVSAAMKNLNIIVLLFKDQLIKIKTFNSMARVDLSREQRLAKYDKLIQQFLNIFKQERLKKYHKKKLQGSTQELSLNASQLHKNLQQILIKIIPKREADLA